MYEINFNGQPELELIFNAMKHYPEHKKFYETACFHRCIDILLIDNRNNLIAIEAKISDWKKAIHQANTYQLIADFTYILMPKKKKINDKFISMLNKYGIGLILFDGQNVSIIIKAKKSKLIWEPARDRLNKRIKNNELDSIPPWERLSRGVNV